MNKEQCFYFASIVKPHGVQGTVMVKMDVDDASLYKKIKSCLVEIEDSLIEYTIDSIHIKDKDFALIQFSNMKSDEDAELLIDRDIYLPLELLPPLKGNKFYFHEIAGFRVIDKTYGELGVVNRVLDMPRQDIIEIKAEPHDIMIPITDHIILDVDRQNKTISVDAPEGLIEVYRTP